MVRGGNGNYSNTAVSTALNWEKKFASKGKRNNRKFFHERCVYESVEDWSLLKIISQKYL